MKKIKLVLLFFILFCFSVNAQLGSSNCNLKTDEQLNDMGYETVRAHGAVGDGFTDDTVAIQAAIIASNSSRKAVYFHPGTYLVSSTLIIEQDLYIGGNNFNNENNNMTRYGHKLVGSYCGNEKPVIKLQDNLSAANTVNVNDPFSVFKLFRRKNSDPNSRDDSRSWNTSIHNLTIDLGTNNPGAVGIDQQGAEGCSAQEVTILANDSFAGFYNLNGSGGYTYNVEVIGGSHGIYLRSSRGGSTLVVGLKLRDQTISPIAVTNYVPFGVVGFDISSSDGGVISHINGGKLAYSNSSHDSGSHIFLIDGKIDISGVSTDAIIENTDRSIYLKNIYVKGSTKVHAYTTHIDTPASLGELKVSNPSTWSLINEYSFTAGLFGEKGQLLQGQNTNNLFYANNPYDSTMDIANYLYTPDENVIVSNEEEPPSDLISKHLYAIGLLNPEGANVVSVADYGANPNDDVNDTENIQNAIDSAGDNGVVFLPAGELYDSGGIERLGYYKIDGTITLKKNTRLFGVSRYNSVLDASGWSNPSQNSAVIKSQNYTDATPVIADFKIIIPPVSSTGNYNGIVPEFENHVYSIDWQSGENSIYKDVFTQNTYGPFGDRKVHVISNNGGGKWYGITQAGSYPPCQVNAGNCNNSTANNSYTDTNGNLVSHPESRKMLIDGTSQKLSFYPYHCQHDMPVSGALWEIINASNVNVYGIKSEMGSIPEHMMNVIKDNDPNLVPVWLFIKNSNNISLYGHEGTSQTAQGRGLIEVSDNSFDITVTSMGRRGVGLLPNNTELNQDSWCFVKEIAPDNTINTVTAQGFLSLFKSRQVSPLSISENAIDLDTVILFPNPTKNYLNITSKVNTIDSISVVDLLGKKVFHKLVNDKSATANLNNVNSGLYLVTVYINNRSRIFKIIKK
ncbi:glycosyl hydrolase family 28-related protein [Wocania ichthyoenteri]|uniref:glycosyl hydrolase family 28-related protein n=1 Tax=Wocania ichthyoenteri TaxID=1230531 RepID=UPI00053E0BEC|nr:glycosyl hydrolase family 28-related protein [Wocania ichthyoenteri]